MAKFNLNQLLNEKSVSGAEEENGRPKKQVYKVVPLSVYDLEPSKDNFYSTEQIEELKTSIEMFGVKQNLTVKAIGGGKYRIIAGHRRRLASLALVEEGKPEFEYVPCGIETEEDAIKERLLLITTNSTARQLSDWEKIKQAEEMRELLEELKGREKLPGRLRDLIAETLNTSPAQIGRMEAISKNLTPEFKDELKEGRVNLSTAYELSGLPEEQQKEAFDGYKEKGTVSIKDAKAKKQAAKQPEKPLKPVNQKAEQEPTNEPPSPPPSSQGKEEQEEQSKEPGLYIKYNVFKVEDGTPVYNCFVLRPDKDPAARAALRAYAEAAENEALRNDIREWLKSFEGGNDNA